MIGGKYVDQGEYGCVFSEELKCKGKVEKIKGVSDDLSYSKIMLPEEAEIEFSIAKRISMIPLFRNYFVISEIMCTPDKKQKEKEIDKCDISDKISDFTLLKMPFGGTSLNRWKPDLKSLDFMKFVIHLVEAGALLNLFGILHRDLHDKNIIVKEDVPRIIDFNLSIDIKKKSSIKKHSDELNHRYNVQYFAISPDHILVNAVSQFNVTPDSVINAIVYKKDIMKYIVNILGVRKEDMVTSLEKFYYTNKDTHASSNGAWFEKYWNKHDSWAIGMNILSLINRFSLYPEFSKFKSNILYHVLRKMCEVSPYDRFDCVQALYHLDKQSFIIRKYANSWLNTVGHGTL